MPHVSEGTSHNAGGSVEEGRRSAGNGAGEGEGVRRKREEVAAAAEAAALKPVAATRGRGLEAAEGAADKGGRGLLAVLLVGSGSKKHVSSRVREQR